MNPSTARRSALVTLVLACLLAPLASSAQPLGSYSRVTTPNGRQVLEIRQGRHPANPNLLFTAVITAGPVSGSTSLLLQQAFARDIFNAAAPAAGWTVVRSSVTAFSLGGGCGRSNLLDFPFINNNRPEILRITGTTQQVITLGIGNTDQYDSIDCRTAPDGRVVYMLTNRTRSTLELRREQGGLLVLVRDNFGVVATPFRGGQRPSIWFARARPGAAPTPDGVAGPAAVRGNADFYFFFFERIAAPILAAQGSILDDDDGLTPLGDCPNIATRNDPGGFNGVKESAVNRNTTVGNVRDNNTLWGDYFYIDAGGCTLQPPAENLGPAGPFGLYPWAGVVANEAFGGGNGGVFHSNLVVPNNVITDEGPFRHTTINPFGNRGGPVSGCPLVGSEIEGGLLLAGPGASSTQVQNSIISTNLNEIVFGSGFEETWNGIRIECDPANPP